MIAMLLSNERKQKEYHLHFGRILSFLLCVQTIDGLCVCSDEELELLAQYAFVSISKKTPELTARFRAWKNTPNPTPEIVELPWDRPEAIHPQLTRVTDQLDLWPPRTVYEYRVLTLRRGDTAEIDGERFVLGNFQGSGNMAHVFETTQVHPVALKIPFYYFGDKILARYYMEKFVTIENELPPTIKRVRVLDPRSEQYHYALVDLLGGNQDGKSFMLSEEYLSPTPQTQSIVREKVEKLHAAIVQYYRAKNFPMPAPAHEAYLSQARQFVWDGQDWVLVDWE